VFHPVVTKERIADIYEAIGGKVFILEEGLADVPTRSEVRNQEFGFGTSARAGTMSHGAYASTTGEAGSRAESSILTGDRFSGIEPAKL